MKQNTDLSWENPWTNTQAQTLLNCEFLLSTSPFPLVVPWRRSLDSSLYLKVFDSWEIHIQRVLGKYQLPVSWLLFVKLQCGTHIMFDIYWMFIVHRPLFSGLRPFAQVPSSLGLLYERGWNSWEVTVNYWELKVKQDGAFAFASWPQQPASFAGRGFGVCVASLFHKNDKLKSLLTLPCWVLIFSRLG